MGKTIGGTKVGPRNIDVIPGGTPIDFNSLRSLRDIQDRRVRLDVQEGISRFEAVYGIQTQDIKVGDLPGAYGAAFVTGPNEGTIILDDNLHSDYRKLVADKLAEYKSGFKVKTNAPAKHTVIHELGHITWNTVKEGRGGKWRDAGKEIRSLYSEYRKDFFRKRPMFSMYGTMNVDEFFAEAITGSIIGTKQVQRNKYIKGIRKIVKKYKL